MDPAARAFDLPDITPESDAGGWPWYRHRDWRNWQDDEQSDEPGVPDRADYVMSQLGNNRNMVQSNVSRTRHQQDHARPVGSTNQHQPDSSPVNDVCQVHQHRHRDDQLLDMARCLLQSKVNLICLQWTVSF